jgi:hypothetical protein
LKDYLLIKKEELTPFREEGVEWEAKEKEREKAK